MSLTYIHNAEAFLDVLEGIVALEVNKFRLIMQNRSYLSKHCYKHTFHSKQFFYSFFRVTEGLPISHMS